MDGRTGGGLEMDRWTDGWIDGWVDGRKEERMDGWNGNLSTAASYSIHYLSIK
jgi:hypothetical protein